MIWRTNDATGGISTATVGTSAWPSGLKNPAIATIAINERVVIFTLIQYVKATCPTHERHGADYDMLYYNAIGSNNPKDASVHRTQGICPP